MPFFVLHFFALLFVLVIYCISDWCSILVFTYLKFQVIVFSASSVSFSLAFHVPCWLCGWVADILLFLWHLLIKLNFTLLPSLFFFLYSVNSPLIWCHLSLLDIWFMVFTLLVILFKTEGSAGQCSAERELPVCPGGEEDLTSQLVLSPILSSGEAAAWVLCSVLCP